MSIRILTGDCREVLKTLPDQCAHCCVTSPPYFGLRDYGVDGQIGLEQTPDEYVAEMVAVFREVRRVLRDDGTLWLNLGDSYASQPSWGRGGGSTLDGRKQGHEGGKSADRTRMGLKPKDLIGIPWRVAFALQADGWYLRQDIIWHKPNPMPESVRDRCTKAHEYIFLFSKSPRYYFDAEAVKEDSVIGVGAVRRFGAIVQNGDRNDEGRHTENDGFRNRRSVWTVSTKPFKGAHFATFPPDLIEPCILAGCPKGGTVLDPFGGAGTTGLCADRLNRNAVLIELNPEYVQIAKRRLEGDVGMFAEVVA